MEITAPPLMKSAGAETPKYIFLNATSRFKIKPGNSNPHVLFEYCTMSCAEFFADSGRGKIYKLLSRLLYGSEPSTLLVDYYVKKVDQIHRTIAENPLYSEAPLVPVYLFLGIREGDDRETVVIEMSLAKTPCRSVPEKKRAKRESECDNDRNSLCWDKLWWGQTWA